MVSVAWFHWRGDIYEVQNLPGRADDGVEFDFGSVVIHDAFLGDLLDARGEGRHV